MQTLELKFIGTTTADMTRFMKAAWAILRPGAPCEFLNSGRKGDQWESEATDRYGTATLGFTVREINCELDRGHYTESTWEVVGEAHGLGTGESLRANCFGRDGRLSVLSGGLSVHTGDERENKIARSFERAFNPAPPPSGMDLDNMRSRARIALRQRSWYGALGHGHEVLKHRPRDLEALLIVGVASGAAGDQITSEIALTDVLGVQPDHVDALYNLAQLRKVQGRDAEALSLYERARAADPGNHAVLYQIAGLLEAAQKLEAARAAYEQALAASPNPTGTWGFSGMDFTGAARHALARLDARS